MSNTPRHTEILLELALSLGDSPDLDTLLKRSLPAFARKLSCAWAAVLYADDGAPHRTVCVPRSLGSHAQWKSSFHTIMADHLRDAQPLRVRREGNYYLYVFSLEDFGVLILGRSQTFTELFLNSLTPVIHLLARMCVSCRDYQRLRTSEKALRASEALMNATQRLARIGGWEYELASGRTVWTQEVYRIHELDPANPELTPETLSEHIRSHFTEEDRPVFNSALRDCIENGIPYDLELRFQTATERQLWVRATAEAVWKEGRIVRVVGNVMDITERKEAEEGLRQLQKMESVGRLAGGIAHDFNNMLGIILGHADFAMQGVPPDSRLYADLQQIHHAAKRSTELIRQLLAFARKQIASPSTVNLNENITEMLRMLRSLIGDDKIALHWLPGDVLWPVRIDPVQLDQVLANLCVNARDALKNREGEISIRTQNISFDRVVKMHEDQAPPGEYVMLSVGDNGCGMDRHMRAKAFEPFYTTKDVGEGTGLGLSTVYGIVKQNGGYLDIRTAVGEGTEISIYLPKTRKTKGDNPVRDSIQSSWVTGHETLLLVEDEEGMLNMTARMLRQQGYHVMCAGSARDAILLARENAGHLHLLVTDIVMPQMNGRELAEELKLYCPDMACLFMSGHHEEIAIHQVPPNAKIHFLAKPFNTRELSMAIRSALNDR